MSRTRLDKPPAWAAVLFPALAGGMGWGIRGQYGHETGAMIAGVLVALTLALLFSPDGDALRVARAVAWGTLAMGIGGSMTYAQTVGLTHDAPLMGNWAALRWGLLGLAVKGAIWIGFAGAFLGMGLSGCRYRPGELALLMLALLAVCAGGIWLVNEPFDPARRVLPAIYFSADWRWLPNADLKPRREVWGGLLAALVGLVSYLRWRRHDPLAPRLALWGMLGGAVGFPLGQSVQAFAAWNSGALRAGVLHEVFPLINWWNFMETTFGAVMGAMLGLGLWLNRNRVSVSSATDAGAVGAAAQGDGGLARWVEWSLLAMHTLLLTAVEFGPSSWKWAEALYDFGLVMVLVPLAAVAGGRVWPWWVIFPVVTLPIAGKTALNVVAEPVPPGANELEWLLCLGLPLVVTVVAAVRFAGWGVHARPAQAFLRPALLLMAWLFFGLNFVFFQFPWPWAQWTMRTPNAIVFFACAAGLTWLAVGNSFAVRPPAEGAGRGLAGAATR